MEKYFLSSEVFCDKDRTLDLQKRLQTKYDTIYGNGVVTLTFERPTEHVYKFVWKRKLSLPKAKKVIGAFDAELITGLELSSVKPLEFSDLPASKIKGGHILSRSFQARYIKLMRNRYKLRDNKYAVKVYADDNELQLTIRFLPITGVVYSITNTAKGSEYGWMYIGETIDEANRRRNWKKMTNKYANQRLLEAREQWGLQNFKYKVRYVVDEYYDLTETKSELQKIEAHFIQRYNTTVTGYNESHYGTGNSGREFSETHRANIGKASTGRHHTEEVRAKISKALKGGHRLDSTKAAISAGNKGKIRTPEQRKAQSERMKGNKPVAAILGAQLKRAELGHGFTKGIKQTSQARSNMKAAQQLRGTAVRAFAPDGTTKDYNTMLDAAKDIDMNVGSIGNNLKSGGVCRNGYRFKEIPKIAS